MPQQVRTRKQTVVSYQASSRKTEPLHRGMIYRELMLQLTGTIDVGDTYATGDIANLQPGDEWGVVERIDIIANGTDVLRSISGTELRMLNLFVYGNPPRANLSFAGAANDAAIAFKSTLLLPFWTPNSLRPIDTALDSRLLSDLRIEITWGNPNSIVKSSVANVAFTVDPKLSVYSLESFGVDGPFAQSRIFRKQESSVGVQDQFEIDLPVGVMYQGFLIRCQDSNGNDLANAISNLKVKSGTTVFWDVEGDLLQDWSMSRSRVQERGIIARTIPGVATTPAVPAIPAYRLPYFVSSNSNPEAWYYFDLRTDGRMTECIDTIGFSELLLDLKIGAAIATLTVLPLQVVPVRGNVKG